MLKQVTDIIKNKGSLTFDEQDRMKVSGPPESGLVTDKKGMGVDG